MPNYEQNQDHAGYGNDHLFADGGTIEPADYSKVFGPDGCRGG
jgi:hypothetical protein